MSPSSKSFVPLLLNDGCRTGHNIELHSWDGRSGFSCVCPGNPRSSSDGCSAKVKIDVEMKNNLQKNFQPNNLNLEYINFN